MTTLVDRLAATADGSYTFHAADRTIRRSSTELAERAQAKAYRLVQRGVRPGDRVGLLGPNDVRWVEWAFATWMAGAALVPVAYPLRIRDGGAFAEQLDRLATAAACRVLIADPELVRVAPAVPILAWDDEADAPPAALPSVAPGDEAIVQFTSGSTAAPKGAILTHAAVTTERAATVHALGMDATDVVCGWMPFFFDGGLCTFVLLPALHGLDGHVMSVEDFARDPARWLTLMGATGATISACPPTALGTAVRAADRDAAGIDLSSLRVLGVGAEGVDPDLVDEVLERTTAFGLRPEAPTNVYGLGEAVCVVSSTPVGEPIRVESIDPTALAASNRAAPTDGGKRVASCGVATRAVEVSVRGPNGRAREREIGDVLVRGPTVMKGYVGDAASPVQDGWLSTGDLGYVADGELFVVGRTKDVVFVYGRNYHPEDFEWAAGRVDGVRRGRCVAFGQTGSDGAVVLIVEPAADADAADLALKVRHSVIDAVGVASVRTVVVPPGTVRKTTSGKLRRSAMRDLFDRGELVTLASS